MQYLNNDKKSIYFGFEIKIVKDWPKLKVKTVQLKNRNVSFALPYDKILEKSK